MTTTLKIEGMTCGHCVQAVTKALKAVPGVVRADVVLDNGTAEVEGDVPVATLRAAIEEKGYVVVMDA